MSWREILKLVGQKGTIGLLKKKKSNKNRWSRGHLERQRPGEENTSGQNENTRRSKKKPKSYRGVKGEKTAKEACTGRILSRGSRRVGHDWGGREGALWVTF